MQIPPKFLCLKLSKNSAEPIDVFFSAKSLKALSTSREDISKQLNNQLNAEITEFEFASVGYSEFEQSICLNAPK